MQAQAHTSIDPPLDQLSSRDFARLADLIHTQVGIKMPPAKKSMLEGRLRRRLRPCGVANLSAYCAHLFRDENLAEEGRHLINAVTTNKTDFFREPRHFDYLRTEILPVLAASGKRRIRAWSAACSTGAEPYTLAMVLDDFMRTQDGPSFDILATDVDTEVLEAARRGIYPADHVEPVPSGLHRRYVLPSRDSRRQDVRIVPALRQTIGYARLNLMDFVYPIGEPMDLIFCRNVLIYFDKQTQRKVIARLIDCLAPDGHLFLGHSESIAGLDLPLVAVASTVFKRS